jgi:uncharacterized protein
MQNRSLLVAIVLLMAGAFAPPATPRVSAQSGASLVISQVYGAGGNTDAVLQHDYVEVFNRGTASASLAGHTIQYTSSSGTGSFAVGATLAGTLSPGQYLLVRMSGGANGTPLPTPDIIGTSSMAAAAGKVALVAQTTGLGCNGGSTACSPAQLAAIVDLVGYGTGTNFFEGGGPTPSISTTLAAFRRNGGCTDTNDNGQDFVVAAPAPRNTASPFAPCTAPTNPAVTAADATAQAQQAAPVVLTASVTPGTHPPSSGLTVSADLSALGGVVNQPFADDGVLPDAAAGDYVFTTSFVLNPALAPGAYLFTVTVEDAELRSGTDAATLTLTPPPVILRPHDVQGSGAVSPIPLGTSVTVRGVVTARKTNGFFVQTEPGFEDADPLTSEGLLIFSGGVPTAAAAVGRLVTVSGTVAEFGNPGVTVTELAGAITVTDLGPGTLPNPYPLTPADVSPTGTRDQLERFEGMRVFAASVTAVAGTDGSVSEATATGSSFGEVDVVLTGQPRPFREPGLEPGAPLLPCANTPGPCNLPHWDGNPELFRIDTNGIAGTSIRNVSTGAVFTNVVGPLDHAFGNYVVLAETQLEPAGGLAVLPAPAAAPTHYTVASLNMQRFFDTANDPGKSDAVLTATAYNNRLTKASLMIRETLNLPDIIGVQEVENLAVLQDLAARVNMDAGAANPGYQAFLEEGNDPGGIDVGFLVKTGNGRVTIDSVEQIGLAATFVDPGNGSIDLLNDRPPLVLRATIQGPATALPQPITVINNHLRSLNGVDANSPTGVRVRAKRQAQAEFLASYIQGRQINDPAEAIVSLGDYNAFSFNDGYGDVMGTIRGEPAPADEVVVASTDLVEPNLVELAAFIAEADRYSYIFEGSAQTLDHVLATANLVPQFAGLVHARVNADFPESARGDISTPARLSDHDPAVAYFTFPPDVTAPVFTTTPADLEAEATSAAGGVVTFATPEATDNLDASVAVTCAPASGATFAVGNTGVTCTAEDLAGNSASVSFTVSVTLPVEGRMSGAGQVGQGALHTVFNFQVWEEHFTESGALTLQVKDGPGRPQQFVATAITGVAFTSGGTVVFAGAGSWNGQAGYMFTVTAADHGVPGPGRDELSFAVSAPDGSVVASFAGVVRAGNIQSH